MTFSQIKLTLIIKLFKEIQTKAGNITENDILYGWREVFLFFFVHEAVLVFVSP